MLGGGGGVLDHVTSPILLWSKGVEIEIVAGIKWRRIRTIQSKSQWAREQLELRYIWKYEVQNLATLTIWWINQSLWEPSWADRICSACLSGLVSASINGGSLHRDGIFKLLRSPGIDSKESIPTVYVAWRAGTTTLFPLGSKPP